MKIVQGLFKALFAVIGAVFTILVGLISLAYTLFPLLVLLGYLYFGTTFEQVVILVLVYIGLNTYGTEG